MIQKQVSFGESSTHEVDTVPLQFKSRMWYSHSELQLFTYKEIEKTRAAATLYGGDVQKMEQRHQLSWRGIESAQKLNGQADRERHVRGRVRIVVEDYKRQIQEFGNVDEEDLRAVAKAHSKKDRVRARRMAKADQEEAQRLIKEEQTQKEEKEKEKEAREQSQSQQQPKSHCSKSSSHKSINNSTTVLMNMIRKRRHELFSNYCTNHKSTASSSSRFNWFQNNNKPPQRRHDHVSAMTIRAALGA